MTSSFQEKYLNPLTDFGFKKLFGTEPNKVLLIDFLNQILPSHHRIKDLTYARNEHAGASEIERKAIFDLYCVGESGERFIVELQKAKQHFFKDRSVYYASFPLQQQGHRGAWNYELDPVYTVGILDFIFDEHKEEEELLHLVELKNQRCEVFYDKLKFIYIELPKFNKTESELETHFDKWLYVFRHLPDLNARPAALQDRIFNKLFEAAEIAKFTLTELEAYESSLKYFRDWENTFETVRMETEAKVKAAVKKAEAKAEESERQRLLKTAATLNKAGVSVDIIMSSVGLSKEEIERL